MLLFPKLMCQTCLTWSYATLLVALSPHCRLVDQILKIGPRQAYPLDPMSVNVRVGLRYRGFYDEVSTDYGDSLLNNPISLLAFFPFRTTLLRFQLSACQLLKPFNPWVGSQGAPCCF